MLSHIVLKNIVILAVKGSMNSTSTHFVPPSRVGIYEPLHQFGMWGEPFKNNIGNGGSMNTPSHIIIPNNQKLDNNNLVPFFASFLYQIA